MLECIEKVISYENITFLLPNTRTLFNFFSEQRANLLEFSPVLDYIIQ